MDKEPPVILDDQPEQITVLGIGQVRGRTILLVGGTDDSIRLWDLEKAQALPHFIAGQMGVSALMTALWQDRFVIISGGCNRSIRIWDFESHNLLCTFDTGAKVIDLAFEPPCTLIVGTTMGLMSIQLHNR
jgi:WD40 repeat protein